MTSNRALPPSNYRRHQPASGRAHAERILFEEIEHAANLLLSKEDFGRAAAIHAIHACYSFLHLRGISGQALKPLIDLHAALEAVQQGTLPEIFDPKLRAGELPSRKWSRSPAATERKVYAAATMDALMDGGASKDNASRRVARCAKKWRRTSGGMIQPSTVANWRDELRQASNDDPARMHFEGLSKALKKNGNLLKNVLRDGPIASGGIRPSSET